MEVEIITKKITTAIEEFGSEFNWDEEEIKPWYVDHYPDGELRGFIQYDSFQFTIFEDGTVGISFNDDLAHYKMTFKLAQKLCKLDINFVLYESYIIKEDGDLVWEQNFEDESQNDIH